MRKPRSRNRFPRYAAEIGRVMIDIAVADRRQATGPTLWRIARLRTDGAIYHSLGRMVCF